MAALSSLGIGLLLLAGQDDEAGEDAPRFQDVGLQLSGGPASWGDVDGDGWVDLNAGGQLWRNRRGEGFERVGDIAPGPFADFDGDGDLDLFAFADQRLLLNDGAGAFTPVPLPDLQRTSSRGAALGDFDGDGWIDAYVGGYEDWNAGITYPDHLLRGEGETLTLAWEEGTRRARGVTACDFDEDGDLDVYVSNYRLQPNRLWQNDGEGAFEDVAVARNAVATSPGFGGGHSIGAAWGDFDGDGRFDLFAGNFAHVDSRGDQPKSRFLRGGADAFEDKGACGVFYQESYASPAAGDVDNDGDLDLWFTTVYGTASFGVKNNAVLFVNEGGWTFRDGTAAAGLAGRSPTYQAAFADFDRDGDLDLVTDGRLFENRGPVGHWLEVALAEHPIGAQVRLRAGGRTLVRQVEAGTGEGNANDLCLHFGLGDHSGPVTIVVRRPGAPAQTIQVPRTDRLLVVPPPG